DLGRAQSDHPGGGRQPGQRRDPPRVPGVSGIRDRRGERREIGAGQDGDGEARARPAGRDDAGDGRLAGVPRHQEPPRLRRHHQGGDGDRQGRLRRQVRGPPLRRRRLRGEARGLQGPVGEGAAQPRRAGGPGV
ncbi:MAG: hypothetical protein AVDCRST_MAG52-918, partial [uncultured Blastococcus sp.]